MHAHDVSGSMASVCNEGGSTASVPSETCSSDAVGNLGGSDNCLTSLCNIMYIFY